MLQTPVHNNKNNILLSIDYDLNVQNVAKW